MNPKIIIKATDGTQSVNVRSIGVPSGSIQSNGTVDLGQGQSQLFATVSQATTAAPSFSAVTTTLNATPTWARTNTGIYTLTLTGAWTENKTFVQWTNGDIGDPTSDGVTVSWARTSANVLTFKAFDIAGAAADWHQTNATLQIIVIA